jgi:ATP-binding cassette subfamily B protein
LNSALDDCTWRSLASVYAAALMVGSIRRSGGSKRCRPNCRLLESFFEQIRSTEFAWEGKSEIGTWSICPPEYWPVFPAPPSADGDEQLLLRGAVLVRVRGRSTERYHTDDQNDRIDVADPSQEQEPELARELAAAAKEPPPQPARDLFRLLRGDGLLSPILLVKGLFLAAAAVCVEAVLFRSLIDIGSDLHLTEQRMAAIAILATFLLAVITLNIPIIAEVRRLGRHLEIRMRAAILDKLTRLEDRYLRSRLISDMAERSHSVHLLRNLPGLTAQLLSSPFQLLLTTAGIIWVAPASAIAATSEAVVSVILPLLAQPVFAERDFRVRNLAGALCRFYLDAMLGLMPVRAHAGERAVRDTHERLLIDWARAGLKMQHLAVAVDAFQLAAGYLLAMWLLMSNVVRPGEAGSLLLLVYWSLSLPVIGQTIALSIRQYPTYRNVTLRLLEPLNAPETQGSEIVETLCSANAQGSFATDGVGITFENISLTAAGHSILEGLNLSCEPGSHLAIVGPSGAGKSSLVGLLLGWSQPSSGQVLVDRLRLDTQRLKTLRKETAWVDPTVQLWNRSLLDNLRYGTYSDNATSLGQAISISELWELLEARSDGLQSLLGESGALVSGGEGQRVRFARVLLRSQARLVILDEPFTGLDRPRRERLLQSARSLWRNATLLYITHDIAEAASFGRVVVLKGGRILEDGAPANLANRPDSLYREMLETEIAARANLTSRKAWRRLRLDKGRLTEAAPERQLRAAIKVAVGDAQLGPSHDKALPTGLRDIRA